MSSSMLLGLFSWIGDFFKALFDLIPKIMYLLYASLACIIDVMQLFFRKLAGLDVYYVKGEAVTGDLVTNFITAIIGINKDGIKYSALSTVFYSMILFGIIVCFFCTLIAIIKSHYTYDEKSAKGPMQYVYTAGKAVINMLAVPIIVVLGLYVSEALLEALDSITSTTSASVVNMYGKDAVDEYLVSVDTVKGATETSSYTYSYTLASGDYDPTKNYYVLSDGSYVDAVTPITDWATPNTKYYVRTKIDVANSDSKTYIYYDIFGFGADIRYGKEGYENQAQRWTGVNFKAHRKIGSKNATFSGTLFKVAAYNANRVRLNQMGYFAESGWDSQMANFSGSKSDAYGNHLFKNAKDNDQLADMVDMAFACNLHLKQLYKVNYLCAFGGNDIVSFKYFTNFLTQAYSSYSKFNVGWVWYYYDLWQFNILIGFAGCIVCVSIFINVILGLITRLFMCIILFLIAPPLFGLAPLDGGGAAKKWRDNFMKQVLMTYGAVVGMNLMLMILPYFNEIDFFGLALADLIAQSLIIIVGLITIKAVIAVISEIIGAADANKTGEGIAKEVGQTIGKAGRMTMGAAKIGVAGAKLGLKATGKGAEKLGELGDKLQSKGFGMIGTAGTGARGALQRGLGGLAVAAGSLGHGARNIKNAAGAVGRFAGDVGNGAKNGLGWLKGKITGDQNVAGAQNTLAERQQMDAVTTAMQGLRGSSTASFDSNAFRQQLVNAGVQGQMLENAVQSAVSQSRAGGTFTAGGLHNAMVANDNTYRRYASQAGANNLNTMHRRLNSGAHSINAAQTEVTRRQNLAAGSTLRRGASSAFGSAVEFFGSDVLKNSFKPVVGEAYDEYIQKEKSIKKDEAATRQSQKLQAKINQWVAQHPGQPLTDEELQRLKDSIK